MLQVIQTSANSTFVKNDDVANCEQIVFAEAVRSGRTMLQVVRDTLEDIDGDDDLQLFCACETLDIEWQRAYTKRILTNYLDAQLYNVQHSK